MAHLENDKKELLARVRRIAGQVGAIERELGGNPSCSEILQLVAGVRGAINGLLDEIIVAHLNAHVARKGLNAETRAAGAEELIAVIRRYGK